MQMADTGVLRISLNKISLKAFRGVIETIVDPNALDCSKFSLNLQLCALASIHRYVALSCFAAHTKIVGRSRRAYQLLTDLVLPSSPFISDPAPGATLRAGGWWVRVNGG